MCDDSSCNRRTQQQSVLASVCLAPGCHGHVASEYSEKALHTQLKYLETLFNVRRSRERLQGQGMAPSLPDMHVQILDLLHEQTSQVGG